jgi:hypothetical protein
MAKRRRARKSKRGVLSKVRKPMAPPARVQDDPKKYRRPAHARQTRRIYEEDTGV